MEQHTPDADVPADSSLPDVADARLIDLLQNRDPALLAAVARLTKLARSASPTAVGWQSAIVE